MMSGTARSLHAGIAFVTVIAWVPGHAASYLGQSSSIPGAAVTRFSLSHQRRACCCSFMLGVWHAWSSSPFRADTSMF